MRNINWDTVPDFNSPTPGGYIAVIIHVEDNEVKEGLKIQWDYASGEYKGYNQETCAKIGFWPTVLYQSYTEKALRFFKAFKTTIERSNNGYVFKCADVRGLEGKHMGVVLGEEEYLNKDGELKTRLYVYQVRSVSEIQAGNYEVPKLKKLSSNSSRNNRKQNQSNYYADQFIPVEEDGTLPF